MRIFVIHIITALILMVSLEMLLQMIQNSV